MSTPENQEGPFKKGHPFFEKLKKYDFEASLGVTYETFDIYAICWVKNMEAALDIRRIINTEYGWEILSKPKEVKKCSEDNPFIFDCVAMSVVPKHIADRNAKYGGDALIGALAGALEGGAEVITGGYKYKLDPTKSLL